MLKNTNIIIHYVTSDPNDAIFQLQEKNNQIKAYYIGDMKLITLMMKMDADVVVMTMPDLDNYQIKRSYVRNDIEYIYVQHGMGSKNMCMRNKSTLHFDTIFCAGKHHVEEEQQIGELYHNNQRKLLKVGYPMIDDIRNRYLNLTPVEGKKKRVLIAPSWQKDNIIDSCLETILDTLIDKDYQIIVRPHPQEVKHKKSYIEWLKKKYSDYTCVTIQTDFRDDDDILRADLLITDWSDICWEFSFATYHPVLFINTPMKVMNPEFDLIKCEPINISLRNRIGVSLELDDIGLVAERVDYLIRNTADFEHEIEIVSKEFLYNIGTSAEVGAQYIIDIIKEKIQSRREVQ